MRIPLTSLLAVTASIALASTALAADVTHSFQSVIPVGGVQRVVIDLSTGVFKVRNGAAGQLGIAGIASRDYDGQRERQWAQKVVDDTSVEFEIRGAEAIVRQRFGPNAKSWRARKFTGYDIRLDLPPGIDVKFATAAGEIDMAGSFGDIDIDMRAGEIRLRLPKEQVRELRASCRVGEVKTNLGDEVVTREGIFPGRTEFFNAGGRSRVRAHVTAGEVHVTLTQ
ncbi:MAG TPA: hypothetical protein VF701_05455 [Thermoanaerobaculia bacterium]